MTTPLAVKQPCPFCPLMGIEPEHYNTIGNDFFGEPASIGGILACDACATVVDGPEHAQELISQLMCPFCPLTGIEGQRPIEIDYFGEPCTILGIRSCGYCEWVAEHSGTEKELVEDLRERQATGKGAE